MSIAAAMAAAAPVCLAPINTTVFPGTVVDWAVVTDRDVLAADRGLTSRVMRWAEVAVDLHGARTIWAMRDDFAHRQVYVATRDA